MSPKAFKKCIKDGGRIRTKKFSKNRYIRLCFLKGKSYAGKAKKKK